jgi:hypothetical protein
VGAVHSQFDINISTSEIQLAELWNYKFVGLATEIDGLEREKCNYMLLKITEGRLLYILYLK